MSTTGEFPVAGYDDNDFPRAFDPEVTATIGGMVPTEIVYMPINPPDPTDQPLMLNECGQLLLSKYAEYEPTEYTDLHNPHEGPVPDWSEPFVGIMKIQKIRADGQVIEQYIVDLRAVSSDLLGTIDFSSMPEEVAEKIGASAIKVFGIIKPDIDGAMNYVSPDNAETEDAAKFLWEHTNSTRPVPPPKKKKRVSKKDHPQGEAPQPVPEGDPEA